MKSQNDISLTYLVRQFLFDDDIKSVVSDLYRDRNAKGGVYINSPLANRLFFQFTEDPDHEGMDRFDKLCLTLSDRKFLIALEKLRVFAFNGITDEDDDGEGMSFCAAVVIHKPEYITHLYNWMMDLRQNLILNYGIFSLHSFTGEAYCMDNKYVFHTGRGLFRVLKAFLSEPTHILTYQQIDDLVRNEKGEKYIKYQINQIVGEIREKLGITGKFSGLIVSSDDKYLLKSRLDL